MTSRSTWVLTAPARRGAAAAAGHPGWRSHTFADGVRSLTLTRPLVKATTRQLWDRLSELIGRGCRSLIVDASAIEPSDEQLALLASAFRGRPATCEAVVVARRDSPFADRLPGWVGVAWTFSDARRQLATRRMRRDARVRPEPGGGIPAGERNVLAVRQALRWAERSAREGDYEHALASLATVQRTAGSLSPQWQQRRRAWLAARRAQAVIDRRARRGDRRSGRPGDERP